MTGGHLPFYGRKAQGKHCRLRVLLLCLSSSAWIPHSLGVSWPNTEPACSVLLCRDSIISVTWQIWALLWEVHLLIYLDCLVGWTNWVIKHLIANYLPGGTSTDRSLRGESERFCWNPPWAAGRDRFLWLWKCLTPASEDDWIIAPLKLILWQISAAIGNLNELFLFP